MLVVGMSDGVVSMQKRKTTEIEENIPLQYRTVEVSVLKTFFSYKTGKCNMISIKRNDGNIFYFLVVTKYSIFLFLTSLYISGEILMKPFPEY